MSGSKAARVRSRLSHPVVDADGQWLELQPVFLEFLSEVGGPAMVDRYQSDVERNLSQAWYRATPEERRHRRLRRSSWWSFTTDPIDRAATMMPAHFYERMDDWGIDVALVYPTMALRLPRVTHDDQFRQALIRAYNVMVSELFAPYADRIIPAAIVALNRPAEAIELLDHAHSLGCKLVMVNGTVPRPIGVDAEWQPDPGRRRTYIDGLGLDSPYDYDPVWRRFVDLKIAVTSHAGSLFWMDRSSPSNHVANHLGHFAQGHHLSARSLVLGGVTQRFPDLNFAFLEGGVGWACSLYTDLIGHWKKRNRENLDRYLKPTNLDLADLRRKFQKYTAGNRRFAGKIDAIIERNLDSGESNISQAALAQRDEDADDFSHIKVRSAQDFERLFAHNFYYGCEADDPMNMLAFDKRIGAPLKPMLGSDISHYDVIDATQVLEEAREVVERGHMTEADFRAFTFGNVVELHGRMNPDFFKGTVVEGAAQKDISNAPTTTAASEMPTRGARRDTGGSALT